MAGEKIKVGPVSYLNTKPLIYGFKQGLMKEEITLVAGYPSAIAQQLIGHTIDIGLVPVAIIPRLPRHFIIGSHCIGATQEVASVSLFSDVPLEAIKTVLLDYQSRTSAALLKILMRDHWKISPEIIQGEPGYEEKIGGTTAGLVIGDRAFAIKNRHPFEYDLAAAWISMTGLPFVFAAWVSNKPMEASFIKAFDEANAMGFSHLDAIIAAYPHAGYDLREYYTNNISYTLDDAKRAGMKKFLSLLS